MSLRTHTSPASERLCLFFEDTDAVIEMIIRARSPSMRHIARTHRVNLDWLLDRIHLDPGIQIKYVNTSKQIADILLKEFFRSRKMDAAHTTVHFDDTTLDFIFTERQQDVEASARPYHRKRHCQTKAGALFLCLQPSPIEFVIELYQFHAASSRERFLASCEQS